MLRKLSLIICFMLFIQTALLSVHSKAFAAEGGADIAPEARSAVLLEMDTGAILFEKNKDQKLPPASITKVMTMLLIMEAINSGQITWQDKVRRLGHPLYKQWLSSGFQDRED